MQAPQATYIAADMCGHADVRNAWVGVSDLLEVELPGRELVCVYFALAGRGGHGSCSAVLFNGSMRRSLHCANGAHHGCWIDRGPRNAWGTGPPITVES
jgi:hypothetical protein